MIMKQVRHGGLKCANCWFQNIVATKFQGQAHQLTEIMMNTSDGMDKNNEGTQTL